MRALRSLLLLAVLLLAGPSFARAKPRSPIVVVAPMAMCAPGDRAYGGALAQHIVTWLKSGGVQADLADDRALERLLAGRRLAYMVLPQTLSAPQLGTLRRFIARGGKLCVFHSSAPELAALMGLRLGACHTPAVPYSAISFACGPAGTPAVIVQKCTRLFAVTPRDNRARVYATWRTETARGPGENAVVASAAGWWINAAFSAGGDERAKQQFLLAVAGSAMPGVWNAAAFRARECREYAQTLQYARAQVRRPGEIHAVWDHTGEGLYPGNWPRTMRTLAATGITDIFVNVAGAGFAHYPTPYLPPSAVLQQRGDQLAACLAAARGTGIRVHAWVLCFTATRATPAVLEQFNRRAWRVRNTAGALTEYLNPARADVQAYVLKALGDLVRRYPVQGVHLDFVRGYEGASKPAAAAHVTAFVTAVRRQTRTLRPQAWLTAAVLANPDTCRVRVGQDWEHWLRHGLVDYVVPMNYTHEPTRYGAYLARQCATPAQARRIISGLGVTANESHLNARAVIDQIRAARRAGAAGVALFDLDYTLATQILPYLRMGLF